MTDRSDTPNRRSIRLHGYDYSRAGAYFITICTQNRACLFGNIPVGTGPCACPDMRLNAAGKMIQTVWDGIQVHYPGIETDEFTIMPNHIHGIIITEGAGARACADVRGQTEPVESIRSGRLRGVAPTALSLPDVVHRFKTMTTKCYADGVTQSGWWPFPGRLWQRNYWEHIIRNESELNDIREYIRNNPLQWEMDKLFVNMQAKDGQTKGRQPRGVAPTGIGESLADYASETWKV